MDLIGDVLKTIFFPEQNCFELEFKICESRKD